MAKIAFPQKVFYSRTASRVIAHGLLTRSQVPTWFLDLSNSIHANILRKESIWAY